MPETEDIDLLAKTKTQLINYWRVFCMPQYARIMPKEWKSSVDIWYVFRYRLQDAWHHSITELDVLSGLDKDNVLATRLSDWYPKKGQAVLESKAWTIGREVTESIENAIEQNKDFFDVGEIEETWITDGVLNWFCVATKERQKEITAENLWCFEDPRRKILTMKEGKNADILLKLYHEVTDILASAGVDRRFLQLDAPVKGPEDVSALKRHKKHKKKS